MVQNFSNATFKNRKILLVDDQPSFLKSLKLMLTSRGAEVEACTSAEESLTRLAQEEYDLAVLDIIMDDMDGLELFETLRNELRKKDLPVLFVSALFGVRHTEKLNRGPQGKARIVPKSLGPETLLAEIAGMLQRN